MNLYELRKQQKLTQQQVADAVGIGMQAYADGLIKGRKLALHE